MRLSHGHTFVLTLSCGLLALLWYFSRKEDHSALARVQKVHRRSPTLPRSSDPSAEKPGPTKRMSPPAVETKTQPSNGKTIPPPKERYNPRPVELQDPNVEVRRRAFERVVVSCLLSGGVPAPTQSEAVRALVATLAGESHAPTKRGYVSLLGLALHRTGVFESLVSELETEQDEDTASHIATVLYKVLEAIGNPSEKDRSQAARLLQVLRHRITTAASGDAGRARGYAHFIERLVQQWETGK